MRKTLVVLFLLAVAITALAQKNSVPPPPKPEDNGPSLEVTMKFIEDKLNGIGLLNFAVYIHDDTKEVDRAIFKNTISNVVADAVACRVSDHWKSEQNGKVAAEFDVSFLLKAANDIEVMTIEQALKEIDTAAGHPAWTYRSDPPAFILKVRQKDKSVNSFEFYDEDLANRVAKALIHAVELCGGGSELEPF